MVAFGLCYLFLLFLVADLVLPSHFLLLDLSLKRVAIFNYAQGDIISFRLATPVDQIVCGVVCPIYQIVALG